MDQHLLELKRKATQEGTPEAWETYANALERANQFDPVALLRLTQLQERQRRDEAQAAEDSYHQELANQEALIYETATQISEAFTRMFEAGMELKVGQESKSNAYAGIPKIDTKAVEVGRPHYRVTQTITVPLEDDHLAGIFGPTMLCELRFTRKPNSPSWSHLATNKWQAWFAGHPEAGRPQRKVIPDCYQDPHIEIVNARNSSRAIFCLTDWQQAIKYILERLIAPNMKV